MKIKEVIVVEGKDDTKRIKLAVDADTYETNGSALNAAGLAELKQLQERRGLIVFTDPDFNGERLRKMISRSIPGVKHAFIRRDQGVPGVAHGSLGVEHASPADIRAALQQVYTEAPVAPAEFSRADLVANNLMGSPAAKKRRERLGQLLGIGYGNAKQFLTRLNLFQVSRADFTAAIQQVNQEGNA